MFTTMLITSFRNIRTKHLLPSSKYDFKDDINISLVMNGTPTNVLIAMIFLVINSDVTLLILSVIISLGSGNKCPMSFILFL
uniref:Uncharacterized protein n=1 Tax=viral metagenome TaxID=1070528 RepID=A0A6C0CB23_9ZZZZ